MSPFWAGFFMLLPPLFLLLITIGALVLIGVGLTAWWRQGRSTLSGRNTAVRPAWERRSGRERREGLERRMEGFPRLA